jgi:hypothetical protein
VGEHLALDVEEDVGQVYAAAAMVGAGHGRGRESWKLGSGAVKKCWGHACAHR